MSGAKDSRPALQRLLADARARKFDAIVVWKIDRFGRSLRHLVNTLADLEALGVAFISLRDSLDFTTPSGKLQFHVLAAVAEFERSLISERVRAGMKTAIKGESGAVGRGRGWKRIGFASCGLPGSWTKIANVSAYRGQFVRGRFNQFSRERALWRFSMLAFSLVRRYLFQCGAEFFLEHILSIIKSRSQVG